MFPASDGEDDREALAESPGERLFYALGQVYRRWHTGRALVCPWDLDIEELARLLGVWSEVEFTQEGENGKLRCMHFPSEVLVIDTSEQFPWRLLDVWEWGREQERDDAWRSWRDCDR